MKKPKPKHITNITYQDFDNEIFYYITYPNVKSRLYGINVYGNIISLVKNREKIRKPELSKYGYYRVNLRTCDGKCKTFTLSRLVAWEFVGQPENYTELDVNHADGIHSNNYYKNLEWVTPTENTVHKTVYRLAAQAETHGWNSHPKKVIKYILKMINEEMSAPDIAIATLIKYRKIYSPTKTNYDRIRSLVSKIKNNTSWYNLKNDMEGSTTIENITYEKHVGEEVSRVGLHPIAIRKGGLFITGNRL